VPVVAPLAMVTDAGSDRAKALAINVTVDAAGVALVNVTKQVPEPPGAIVTGVHVNEDSEAASDSEIANDFELPLSIAVTFEARLDERDPVCADEKVPACTVNVTDDDPLAAVTAVWETVRNGLLLDIAMDIVAPAGTGAVSMTVQDVEDCGVKELAAHVMADIAPADIKESVTGLVEPLSDAVMVPVWAEGTMPVLAVKFALVAIC
jgi:hypothetical protein